MYLFDVTQRLKQTITRRPSRAVLFFCPMRDGMTGVRQNAEMSPSVLDRKRKESDSFHNFRVIIRRRKKRHHSTFLGMMISLNALFGFPAPNIFSIIPVFFYLFCFPFGHSLLVCPLFFICAMASKENVLFFSIGPYLYPDKYK